MALRQWKPTRYFQHVAVLLLLVPFAALAQDVRQERVHFQAGTSGATIQDTITGYESVDYLLKAQAGQTMSVDMQTSNLSSYFNVLAGNNPAALHVGSTDGNQWTGVLPATEDYRIRVYLMRNAARRNETASFTLSVAIGAGNPDYADGLSGGPDYWEVVNVPANDTLNVRAGPGTANQVVGALANGDRARNLGCRMIGNARWCKIEAGAEMRFEGWVNGRYLREAAGAPGNADATGQIPCSVAAGQPTRQCQFRVSRGSNGNASVWVMIGNGRERYIEFRNGEPITSEAGLDVVYERISDLYLIRMGGVERYEIPDAVVYGG
ncbi:MAG: SH3 domain-containing protein [Nitratireductor sp.]|nr:SH3 domain-containing protein [Nitratireductor sp.]